MIARGVDFECFLPAQQRRSVSRRLRRGRRGCALAVLVLVNVTLWVGWPALAETNASWAWPGMQFDFYEDGSWGSCSVGFPAWDSAGKRYFITAGHCFRTESGSHYLHPDGTGVDIYAPSNHHRPVGFERLYTIPADGWYDDVSLVEMYPGKELSGHGWEHIADRPTSPDVGDSACLVGFRHEKSNCGEVTETDATITEKGYRWKSRVFRTSYCSHPGDSGGAVYNRYGALGIGVTGDKRHNEPGTPGACRSSFVPIGVALRIFRKTYPSLSI